MKKLSTLLLTVIVGYLWLLGLCSLPVHRKAPASVAPITSNTTGTQANSPYNLTGNVVVNKGVTLTIEPGVIVNCAKNSIQVDGTLKVLGASDNKVVFHTNNRIVNSAHEQFAEINFGDDSSDGIIQNAVLETMEIIYYNCTKSITLDNNYFKDQTASTNSGSIRALPRIRGSGNAIITNNVFTGRLQLGCSATLINNTFSGGGVDAFDGVSLIVVNNIFPGYPDSPYRDGYGLGIERVQKSVITDNRFSNYVEACITTDSPALIERNYIQNAPTNDEFQSYPFFGILIIGSSPLIENNTITSTGTANLLPRQRNHKNKTNNHK
jgi:hypothetical protein